MYNIICYLELEVRKDQNNMEMKVVMLCELVATTILVSCLFVGNQAQEQQQQQQYCMNELRFCIGYLNNTSQPPDTCCQPLDYIVKALPQCFCNLISTSLGVNRVELEPNDILRAQTLPGRCGQRINPMECITGTQDARSNNPATNSANSRLWEGFATMTTSLTILGFLA